MIYNTNNFLEIRQKSLSAAFQKIENAELLLVIVDEMLEGENG